MGMIDFIFGKRLKKVQADALKGTIMQSLTAYRPAFRTFNGAIYENELIRAVIDARARHISKLHITFDGAAMGRLRTKMSIAPNSFMTWSQFLYRLSTILDVSTTAFIVPVLNEFDEIAGYFPVVTSNVELTELGGVPYLRYTFRNQQKAAIELNRCAIITKHQYEDDLFGSGNAALNTVMNLINMQNQGITEGIKNSATFRFMARLANFAAPEDLAKERKRFNQSNLQGESGGVLLWPNNVTDIKQIDQKPFVVDADQTKLIQNNVFSYFGVNEKILQNTAAGDDLDAFYSGAIEPFAIQLAEGLTRMTYTPRQIAEGNTVRVTSDRLQYMTVNNKITLARELSDRGILMIDEIRKLFDYPPLPDGLGQHIPARGEYYMIDEGKDPEAVAEKAQEEKEENEQQDE